MDLERIHKLLLSKSLDDQEIGLLLLKNVEISFETKEILFRKISSHLINKYYSHNIDDVRKKRVNEWDLNMWKLKWKDNGNTEN